MPLHDLNGWKSQGTLLGIQGSRVRCDSLSGAHCAWATRSPPPGWPTLFPITCCGCELHITNLTPLASSTLVGTYL